MTEALFLGELLGVVFLFAGFLVSIEAVREIRVPFTHVVQHTRSGVVQCGFDPRRKAGEPVAACRGPGYRT
jgi:hypothetical protein